MTSDAGKPCPQVFQTKQSPTQKTRMINKTSIRINKFVSANKASLIVAGIDPSLDNSELTETEVHNLEWGLAAIVRDALLENLRWGHRDPEPVSVKFYKDEESCMSEVIIGIDNINAALMKGAVPSNATFKADDLWPWLVENIGGLNVYNPELFNVLTEIYPHPKAYNTAHSLSYDVKSNEQDTTLAKPVVSTVELQQQAESKTVNHMAEAPKFRYLTPSLQMVAELQEYAWGNNWDPNDKDTDPRNKDMFEWLLQDPRCGSYKRAEAITIVARPEKSPPARVTKKRSCSR